MNNTITKNKCNFDFSAGGGIYQSSSIIFGSNNIIYANTAYGDSEFIGQPSLNYSCISVPLNGAGNIISDPQFVNAANNDFHLQSTSPCIDAGNPTSPTDADGTRADMGALFHYHFDSPNIWVARHSVDDSQGNNNQHADSDETIHLIITLNNSSMDATGISATLTNDDPDVEILQPNADFGNLAQYENADNSASPFEIHIKPNIEPHFTNFIINVIADGGYTNSVTLSMIVGTSMILLVDDDNGAAYESYYTKLFIPAIWETKVQGPPALQLLQQYDAVCWFTGDDRTTSLTEAEQSIIASYLDAGGRLLLTGQNIGYDLMNNYRQADSSFYANYLCANLENDNSNATMTMGVATDPISNNLFAYFLGPGGGAGNQNSPDAISALSSAELILNLNYQLSLKKSFEKSF